MTPPCRTGPCASAVAAFCFFSCQAAPGFQAREPELRQPAQTEPPVILLANTDHLPHVTVSWPTRDGKTIVLEGDRPYQSPGQKQSMGGNMSSYVALGGSRLERGAGHPKGAIVRVGLYKEDPAKPLFENLADEPSITIRLTNVHMNMPATPRPESLVMHLRYSTDDLVACGLGGAAVFLYLTADPKDTLLGKITEDNGRLGALDGSAPDRGRATFRKEPDGSVSMEAVIPYGLLRHVKDPWRRAIPGTFLEPVHCHLEFEMLPDAVYEELRAERAKRDAATKEGQARPAPAAGGGKG